MRLFAPSLLTPALGIAAALALGGCQGQVNRGVESVNQPVVSRTDYVFDVGQGGYSGLQSGESERLGQWFDTLRLGYGDRVTIDDRAHGGGAAAREAVAALVARYGLLLADPAPVTTGVIAADRIRVVVSRSRADVPDCPNWHRQSEPELAASTSSNYGCAINGNLAAMIADPQDLVRGVSAGNAGVDPRASARALKTYREAPSTAAAGLKTETTKGGS